jgi:hypothetical protein
MSVIPPCASGGLSRVKSRRLGSDNGLCFRVTPDFIHYRLPDGGS